MLTNDQVDTARAAIGAWVESFLSKNSDAFGGLPPCPFAKKAWVDGKVCFASLDDNEEIVAWITRDFQNYEVGCLIFDPRAITSDELEAKCRDLEALAPGFVFLDDHPEHAEIVGDVVLNQGDYALIFVQTRSDLDRARKSLDKTDYYKNWSDHYKKEVLR